MTESDERETSMTAGDPLAAVVRKGVAEAAIRSLRAEGVYDEQRRVRERDDETIEVPVTEAPAETDVLDLVRQVDPEPRVTGLADLLREQGFSDEEVDRAPSSWAVVGTVVLARFDDCPRRQEVAEALLELHGEADTVVDGRGVDGVHREPEVDVVAGEGDTETVHVEHGTRYALDLSRVMFSPGNKAERARMGEVVAGEAPPAVGTGNDGDEQVLDMFAGVGYFALPMARAGARVTAVEHNPTAFQYLLENASLNDVTDRVDPYRGDCREVVDRLPAESVDRVVMGYYDATDPGEAYLDPALHAVAPGGVLHVHAAVPEMELWDRPVGRIEAATDAAGRTAEVLDRRTVKTHSEGVSHVVLDVQTP
ncbi:class I SAM-dependent methyltransferase family protein [Halobacteriales archaeon QS_1_68_20]|nr:MAG: class I SAM-dependent methyltransferase family protein [Halobacteriales archaeon QS_1_68_20]